MKKLFTLTALGSIFLASQAVASGYNLKEQSASAQANAFAGATAGAEDISYSYFNVAGLTRHKGTHFYGGGAWVAPYSKLRKATSGGVASLNGGTTTSSNKDNIVRPAFAPSFYFSHQLNDRWFAGASLNVPFGMVTKYDDDWAGRFHGTLSKLTVVNFNPMVAYKVKDDMSIGAGLQMQYIKARLRNSVYGGQVGGHHITDKATVEGDDFSLGYQLGALYEYSDTLRFGIGYRSKVEHKLGGDIEFDGPMSALAQSVSAELTMPAILTLGAYHDINDKWAVMAEITRNYWSAFDELVIEGKRTGLRSTTDEKWSDTTAYSIGASYKYNDKLKFRFGVALDQKAVGNDYRTPRIPDSDRIWYAGGIQYKYNDKITYNLAYTYIDAKTAKVYLDGSHSGDAARGPLFAEYRNSVHIIGFGINYNF